MTLQSPPLVSRTWLLELLRREMFDETEHVGDQYVKGHNARARSLIATLSQGSVEAGLVELAESKPHGLSGVVSFDLIDCEVE